MYFWVFTVTDNAAKCSILHTKSSIASSEICIFYILIHISGDFLYSVAICPQITKSDCDLFSSS